MPSIVTWNVNGLRACAKKGYLAWLEAEGADLVCLQETKAHPEQLDPGLREPAGWHTAFASAEKRGYSGVALYGRELAEGLEIGLGIEAFDREGRTIVADYGEFVLINGYFPNSQHSHARLPYKLDYDAAVLERSQALRASGREVVICGDFNAAHTPLDLARPKPNTKNAGFLPEERAWVDDALATGLVDVFRARHPDENGHYSWWSYRMNARARNIGWRLDYFLCSPGIAARVTDVRILKDVMGSDHCPVRLDLA
jgi:exodeoxyribonuclease III